MLLTELLYYKNVSLMRSQKLTQGQKKVRGWEKTLASRDNDIKNVSVWRGETEKVQKTTLQNVNNLFLTCKKKKFLFLEEWGSS